MKEIERAWLPASLGLRPIGTLAAGREELVRRFGPPDFELGPRCADWMLEASCGLYFAIGWDDGHVHVFAEELDELEHALLHLGFRGAQPWVPHQRRLGGWGVIRVDDPGNRYELATFTRESSARCMAARLEARAHKQLYLVERRDPLPAPPPAEPEPHRWALIRQDDHGVRYTMYRHRSRRPLELLADRLEREPRHKQGYFVEPITSA